ncbi:MAG: MerR family transcriptional regulator [Micropruina sp.]|uniref:MerR family transcriptional regulator n=1 Tax=Micropruina sp. TaxID=2737536 RepID=UPI0039E483E5
MLTIGQLADYVGVTPRAIRHYHALGLLAEPERSASGYRSYDAQAVVELHRIKVLADAGVPLSRVGELTDAEPDAFRDAAAQIDADLQTRIAELEATRQALQRLAVRGEPFLPPQVIRMHHEMRSLGVSERTLQMERDAWLLIEVLFPDLVTTWLDTQQAMLDDPGYRDLYLRTDQAFDYPPDDPRIEELAQATVEWVTTHRPPPDPSEWKDDDSLAQQLVVSYRRDYSPGWRRLMERMAELVQDCT